MLYYCSNNLSVHDVWVKKGINRCFFDTVTVNIYADILIIFGLIQWVRYARASVPTPLESRPSSFNFNVQIGFSVLMALLSVLRFCLQSTILEDKKIYGYMIIYFGLNILCWPLSVLLIFIERTKQFPNSRKNGHGDLLLIFWSLAFATENLSFVSFNGKLWWFDPSTTSNTIELSLFILRYISTFALFSLGFKAPGIPNGANNYRVLDGDNQGNTENNGNSASASTWTGFWKKMKILIPFMWPKKNIALQMVVVICFILLIIGRVANVFVPIFYKRIVNALGGDGQEPRFCWGLMLGYVTIKFVQGGGTGGMGFLNNLRSLLWISVQQYTTREVQVKLFAHLHSLSLRWHLGRKTGEVVRIMDRGTNSINQLLSYIVFSILPTVFDIIIAVVYFSTAFNIWFGIIVFCTMAFYLVITIVVTEWRTKYRRSMNLADNAQKTRGVDSLLNYETVKYYGGEEFETMRYKDCILDYQNEEFKSNASLCLLNTAQNIIINGGLLVGSILCAWMVSKGTLTVGDYVLFSTYIIQLYTPLNWFGTYYRMIQQSFIDAENMFELLEEKHEVVDEENALTLSIPRGSIEFRDVNFHYSPEKLILKGVSFKVEPGKTLAVVGPTGAGKTSIMRLLFRFFDVTGGAILIDGINIKSYTQKSLRQAFGVVPQDTVLFNDSVKYNIHYGKVHAPDKDVEEAAKNAEIHNSIIEFPSKYDTMVGERGLKLSGGEKQRIAIARTILKSPTFILLDEATSALDTQTERNIQSALLRICSGRTVVIVAHRLSTVIHADNIVVLMNGSIAEQGRHSELLSQNGIYARMWQQQLENNNEQSNADNSLQNLTQPQTTSS